MSPIIPRDVSPYHPDADIRPGAISPNEAKRAAWAFSLGDVSRYEQAARRAHRGQLPDVDFSRAVPAPRRSLLRRIAAALGFAAPAPRLEPEEWRVIQPARQPASKTDQAEQPAAGNVVPFSRAA